MRTIHFRLPLLAYMTVLVMTLVALPAVAQQAEYYVLDGFGGVHAGGGAPIITPATPYFGFDIAKDIVYVPVGTGDAILVLDGFGGVHTGGALPSGNANPRTPYWGFNIARAIVHRTAPPRAAGSAGLGKATITDTAFTTISSATVVAPDDGFLVVTGTANFGCTAITTSNLFAAFSLDVDSTAGDSETDYRGFLDSCATSAYVDTVTITRLFPVTAGAHTVNFLARKISSSGQFNNLSVLRSSVTVIYVN